MSSLFFSRATTVLAENRDQADRGATRPYVVHQLVADLFGQYDERPFLYRPERSEGTSQPVLILSRQPPLEVDEVPGRTFGSVRSVKTKPFDLNVPGGTRLDFEIRLNATKDVRLDSGRTKRTDVWEAVWQANPDTSQTPVHVYQEYLARKLEGAAIVDAAHLTARGFVRARRNLHQRAITFVAVNVIGSLTVEASDRLRGVMARGIGRSKAFGCGLLCLSRPGSVLPRRHPEEAKRLLA